MTRNDQRIQEYIDRVVAEAPPLTPAQRDRVIALLSRPQKPVTQPLTRIERLANGIVDA